MDSNVFCIEHKIRIPLHLCIIPLPGALDLESPQVPTHRKEYPILKSHPNFQTISGTFPVFLAPYAAGVASLRFLGFASGPVLA